ncbi:MAG: L,D-transpeptidase family protein [Filimonas sp.]|nr:L,D-transpeptidase family protein [Filimonas sp.]
MKHLCYLPVSLLIALSACNTNTDKKHQAEVVTRDYSITASNAYNNIFLDSNTFVSFVAKNKVPQDEAAQILGFYNKRNFEFAWFSGTGLTEEGRGFWNLYNYYFSSSKDSTIYNKTLKKQMQDFILADSMSISPKDNDVVKTELLLTQYFFKYLAKNDGVTLTDKEVNNFIPVKKTPLMETAESIIKNKDGLRTYSNSNNNFKLLKEQLGHYYDVAKKGGWQPIVLTKKKLAKGATDPVVVQIKNRLRATGEMPIIDTSAVFDDTLVNAVKAAQISLGFTPTGYITDTLVNILNIPVTQRISQIIINMNRMKWMPDEPKGKLIVTNIPEYKLYVYDGGKAQFDMKVVVGKDGHNTVIFTGNLDEIIFSPYWNIPPSIVRKEILPSIERNKNYLAQNDMEVVREENGLPVIRQKPGNKNALGKVKFLFPNDFNIYFHDTPAKDLFNRDQRAYSHGCIRLSDPVKLATYLLKDDAAWTPDKINEAMNAAKEKSVMLKNAVTVLVTYYTAWVDGNSSLNFREDIYGHDTVQAKKMFTDQ